MSSKLILINSSYTISKLVHVFETQCRYNPIAVFVKHPGNEVIVIEAGYTV